MNRTHQLSQDINRTIRTYPTKLRVYDRQQDYSAEFYV